MEEKENQREDLQRLAFVIQEAERMMEDLTFQNCQKLLAILQLVAEGQISLALASIKATQGLVQASVVSPAAFDQVKQLVYAAMCPDRFRQTGLSPAEIE